MGFEEIQAYVNLGASLMDLAIPKPGAQRMIGFTRSVPLAGNEMDRAIRDRLSVESMDEARQIKETDAVVLATDHEIDGDPDKTNMEASEAATTIADRIIAELRRSLEYYISQPDGVAVDSIVLSGGLSRMRFLTSYISEKMGVPVSVSEPKAERIRLPDSAPDPIESFALAVGLALQGIGAAQNSINFLPEEIKRMRGLSSMRYELIGMSVMLLGIIGMSWDVGSAQIAKFRRNIDEMNKKIDASMQESARIKLEKERDNKVTMAYEQLAQASGSQDYWLGFLKRFMERRPPEILIDSMVCRVDGNVIITGKSPSLRSVNSFVDELKALSEGTLPPTQENPKGSLAVQLTNIDDRFRDPRYGKDVQAFEITVKSLVRLGRIRSFGLRPNEPAARPAAAGAAAPGGRRFQ
jgi:hypothetical protein